MCNHTVPPQKSPRHVALHLPELLIQLHSQRLLHLQLQQQRPVAGPCQLHCPDLHRWCPSRLPAHGSGRWQVSRECCNSPTGKHSWAPADGEFTRQTTGTLQACSWVSIWPPGHLDKLSVKLTCQQKAQHQAEEHACALHLTQQMQRLTALARKPASGWGLGPHSWVPRMRYTDWAMIPDEQVKRVPKPTLTSKQVTGIDSWTGSEQNA